MSKLVAFFEKKKKKPLKSSLPSAQDEQKPKEEELPLEVGSSVLLPEDQDGGSWSVEPEISPSEGTTKSDATGEAQQQPASWMKVSVVSAASVRKKEVLPSWTMGSTSAEAGKERGEEDGSTSRGAAGSGDGAEARSSDAEAGTSRGEEGKAGISSGGGGGEAGSQETGKGLRGLDALLTSVSSSGGGETAKKFMLPSLRARLSGGGGSSYRGGSSGKPNFDDDQDLATVAQLGLYRTPGVSMQDAAAAARKKKLQQQQQGESSPGGAGEENAVAAEGGNASVAAEKKKKKKKALSTADTPEDSAALGVEGRHPDGGEETSISGDGVTPAGAADTSPTEMFNVWKYVHLGKEELHNCSAAQNNELVREKYIRRKRWGEETTHLEPQPVA